MTEAIDPEFVHSFELETWTRCAPEYLEGFAGMTRETLPMLVESANITKGMEVLDVGSGPGHICGALNELGCKATGIDFSAPMVKIASEKYTDASFFQGNAEDLEFQNESFDSIISNFVVHHLARPEVAFKEIHRVLKKGGRFAYAVFADPAAQSSIGAFFSAVEEHHDLQELPHGPLFGVTDHTVHRDMLRAGGFSDCGFSLRPFVWRTATPKPVLDSFATWGNLGALPDDIAKKIEETTLRNLERFKTESGYEFPHEVLVAFAEK
jgi:SAM-dependent methyltransferase